MSTVDFLTDVIVPLNKIGHSPSYGAVAPLKDGRLMWVWGKGRAVEVPDPLFANYSEDGGKTWSDPQPLKLSSGEVLTGVFNVSVFRMLSGSLGLVWTQEVRPAKSDIEQFNTSTFARSEDEGQTWSGPVLIGDKLDCVLVSNDQYAVLQDGRIIIPACSHIGPKAENPRDFKVVRRFGKDFGQAGVRGGLGYSFVFYSDDQGETWQRSSSKVFVVLDKGLGGCHTAVEPAVVELKDGRLLMMVRTNLGRLYRSYSDDRGQTWSMPEPTELVLLPSPCQLRRIPMTNDLLLIWNQTDRAEMLAGLYRHRLTCAISRDEGKTWENHKNLESLDDVAHLEADNPEVVLFGKMRQPIDRKRYSHAPGPLRCNQPTCAFFDKQAIITYCVAALGDKDVIAKDYGLDYDMLVEKLGLGPDGRANKVRVFPIAWLYNCK